MYGESELIQRRGPRRGGLGSVDPDASELSSGKLSSKLRSMDVIAPKLEQEVEDEMTRSGGMVSGAISLAMFILVAWLVLSQSMQFFLVGDVHETITVDVKGTERLPIRFNISFPSLKCSECNMDVVDKSGEQQLRLSDSIWKMRRKRPSQLPSLEPMKHGSDETEGLGNPIGAPFQDSGKAPLGDADGEGCSIWGEILIKKLAGNLHIALGASRALNSAQHVHNFEYERAPFFNASHIIHELSFGEVFPGMPPNPLTGARSVARDAAGKPAIAHYQYFVNLVPTLYRSSPEDPEPLQTNQYSASEHIHITRNLHQPMTAQTIPGLFISWEFSPFLVQFTRNTRGFLQFLTTLCAIVGGVYTVAGLIDSLIYHGRRMFVNKV